MSPPSLAAAGVATVLAVSAEVTTTNSTSGLLGPLIGAVASVLVAGIAAYAVIRQRRAQSPDEINALATARTVEANLSTLHAQVQALQRQVDDIEEHVRPWPHFPGEQP